MKDTLEEEWWMYEVRKEGHWEGEEGGEGWEGGSSETQESIPSAKKTHDMCSSYYYKFYYYSYLYYFFLL